jgi:hypothetical protein
VERLLIMYMKSDVSGGPNVRRYFISTILRTAE